MPCVSVLLANHLMHHDLAHEELELGYSPYERGLPALGVWIVHDLHRGCRSSLQGGRPSAHNVQTIHACAEATIISFIIWISFSKEIHQEEKIIWLLKVA
jgi:hypothetical protein